MFVVILDIFQNLEFSKSNFPWQDVFPPSVAKFSV